MSHKFFIYEVIVKIRTRRFSYINSRKQLKVANRTLIQKEYTNINSYLPLSCVLSGMQIVPRLKFEEKIVIIESEYIFFYNAFYK